MARYEDGAHVRRSRATLLALAIAAFIVVLVVADMLGAIAFISTDAGASPLTLRAATLLEVSP